MENSFSLVVAMDRRRGVGKNGGLPWTLPPDLKHFKEITTDLRIPGQKNAVIMGRKTWESLPERFRPLPGRTNVVLSHSLVKTPPDVILAKSFDDAFAQLERQKFSGQIFVIGGGQIFSESLADRRCVKIYATHLDDDFNCDVFFPPLNADWTESKRCASSVYEGIRYAFVEYLRQPVS